MTGSVVAPQQSKLAAAAEWCHVPPSYCPAEHLRLEISGRVEKYPIQPGLDAEVTDNRFAEKRVVMPECG
jgi:hypothetical protein